MPDMKMHVMIQVDGLTPAQIEDIQERVADALIAEFESVAPLDPSDTFTVSSDHLPYI